jgi:hypothetical protein
MTYSFSLVANLMALNDANLVAANHYRTAFECYDQLAAHGELKRGSQFFFRLVPMPPAARKLPSRLAHAVSPRKLLQFVSSIAGDPIWLTLC